MHEPGMTHEEIAARSNFRFIAIFGLVYGILLALQTYHYLPLLRNAGPLALVWQAPRLACRLAISVSGIWLIVGCIRLYQNAFRGRGILLSWGIFALAMELLDGGLIAKNSLATSFGYLPWAVRQMAIASLQAGFPLLLIFLITLQRHTEMGFEVITGRSHSSSFERAEMPSTFGSQLYRRIGSAGLIIGILGSVPVAVLALGVPILPWRHADSAWRANILTTLGYIQTMSYPLLLYAAAQLLRDRQIGLKLVFAWAIFFLIATGGGLILFEVPFMYWQARYGAALAYRSITMESLVHLFTAVRECAFALIVANLLWRSASIARWSTPAPGTTTNPITSGL